jgi:hypothetical protein
MSMDTFDFIVGTKVQSSDAQQLGTVKEIVGPYFKVDAPMSPDYWLATSSVRSANQETLVLTFTEEQLGGYQVDEDEVEAVREEEADPPARLDDAELIAWGPDQWIVVRTRIRERYPEYEESQLDDMRERDPRGFREQFEEAIREAEASSEDRARTVEENT